MIVWLASYPRSGNTFLRLMLKQGLGLATYSTHEGDDHTKPRLAELIGHTKDGYSKDLIEAGRNSSEIYVIKTHYVPQTDDLSIYVVRDGRAATVSYLHFCLDSGLIVTMEQLIEGVPYIGSWSSHIASWNPLHRPNTLFLKYEEIVSEPDIALRQVSEFLKVPIVDRTRPSFEELHSLEPLIFRAGDNKKNIGEMQAHEGHFFAKHGPAMVAFGYAQFADVYERSSVYLSALHDRVSVLEKIDSIKNIIADYERSAQTRYENIYYMLKSQELNREADNRTSDPTIRDS